MAITGEKQTRADAVRDQMRQDILQGVMRPGDRLMFPDLCDRYSASVGVTREALASLVSQGLVRTIPHHGHTVATISASELGELVAARLLVEPPTLAMSVRNGGLQWEAQLMSVFHVMSRRPRYLSDETHRVNPEWAQAHDAFHLALFAACDNAKLTEIVRGLSDEAAFYRRWSDTVDPGMRDIEAEHQGLLDAAIAGDEDLAAERLSEHIDRTAKLLAEFTTD